MQIVEIKNNLVKVSYNTTQENLILSGFAVIRDAVQSFIGQIIHLDANNNGNFAVIKLLFTFDENGVIANYNGSIPDFKSFLEIVQPQELLELLPAENPILIGELAQQKTLLKLDRTLLEENLLVCCEKEADNKTLIENLARQLVAVGKKVLVFDFNKSLDFSQNRITAGHDFRLPLNYETINFIYEKGLDNAASETKALIQDIFLEVQNYVKTLPDKFIPFETFKNVVDAQYQEALLVELVLLKNKLLKYYEEGVFAQDKKEFTLLKNSLQKPEATILDLSTADEKIQREIISYAYSLINELGKEVYVICNIGNENSDKKLLKQIFMAKNAYSTLICSYSYKYLKELKQLSKNLILFAPIQQQSDFASYNAFLRKLNEHEFIIYGKSNHYLPLIVKLEEIPDTFFEDSSQEQIQVNEQPLEQDLLDEQIKRDVDEIYTTAKKEEFSTEVVEDELTEEDLDLIDDLGFTVNEETISGNEEPVFNEIHQEELVEAEEIDETMQAEENPIDSQDQIFTHPTFQSSEPSSDFEEEEEQVESFSHVMSGQYQASVAPAVDILPPKPASTPIVPVYSAQVEPKAQSDELEQGNIVTHPKYGRGTVEKLITYGSKTLCSINFDNIGRRLLDPTLVEIKKVEELNG